MTPLQRLRLSGRQAGEQAQRLSAWLRGGGDGRPEIACLAGEIENLAGAVGRIIDAIELRPAIGIAGFQDSGRMALVAALTGAADRPLQAALANREASLDVLSSIVPHGGGARVTTCIRLGHGEPPSAPHGFPVRLRLLSQLDLVKILFRAHAANIGVTPSRVPSPTSIDGLFRQVERNLQPRAVAGLSAREIVDLREDLHGFDPRSPQLRGLAANGYWDRLALVVAHLPEADRTRLLALLWNEEPALTAIYMLLVGTLEKLGHASEVNCELASIVSCEPATGWMVPHRASIIADGTLAGLAGSLGPVAPATVQVSGRYGGALAIDRAVIATLGAELPLDLQSPPIDGLPDTDILTFPAPPAVVDLDSSCGAGAEAEGAAVLRGGLSVEAAVAILGQAKSIYLLEWAARRHQLGSLVVCIDPSQPPDDALANAIGNWIEAKQGAEPHHRERIRTGLFVVATRPPSSTGEAPRIVPWQEAADDPAVRGWMMDGLGADQDWPAEWTPNHRFDNVFAFHREKGGSTSALTRSPRLKRVDSGTPPLDSVFNSSGALIGALQQVATRAKEHRQLGLALVELRRRFRSRILRLHLSNDPLEIAEWRRQVANIAVSRLRRPVSARQLRSISASSLVSALRVSERELAAAIWRALEPVRDRGADRELHDGAIALEGTAALENPSICHDSAAAAVTYWLRAMRQAGRSARFCRHLGVPQSVLQHFLDEIAIGTARVGVVAQLTDAFGRLPTATLAAARVSRGYSHDADELVHLAAAAARTIDGHIASILTSWSGTDVGDAADGLTRTFDGCSGKRGTEGSYLSKGFRNGAAALGGTGWVNSVVGLVEANIAAAPLLALPAERDRELGELLSGFASSPFEVEL